MADAILFNGTAALIAQEAGILTKNKNNIIKQLLGEGTIRIKLP
ncbi:hypothetical protein [Iningainema tapete]|nr:hypothetical protein [Iningainema tapete]